MDPATRRRLATSFERGSQAYAAHRPTYPGDAVRWLAGSEPRDVLDLGAGSGALTTLLAGMGHRVVAAEPSRAMLGELVSRGLAVPAVQSSAEAVPFAPGSFDVVTVATAFHWFDAPAALPQVAWALRPGGRLALVWNSRVETHRWMLAFGELLRAVRPRDLGGDWGTDSVSRVRRSPHFGAAERAEFPFAQRLDRDGLVGLAASRSYVIALPDDRRRRLFDHVGRLFDEAAGQGSTVDLAYLAQCWRYVTRNPGHDPSLA